MVTLSRYFNENVEFVANMCPRCYEECLDVKITSVNEAFLEQVYKKSSQDLKFPNWLSSISQKFGTNAKFLGFSLENAQMSKMYSDTMQKILKESIDGLRIFEIEHHAIKECFEGFTSDDVESSKLYHEKVRNTCNLVKFKIFKRMSLSIIRNIKRRRMKNRQMAEKESGSSCMSVVETTKFQKKGFPMSEVNEEKILLGTSEYFGNNKNLNNNLMEPSKSSKFSLVTEIKECEFKIKNAIVRQHENKRQNLYDLSLTTPENLKEGETFDNQLGPVDYEYEYFRIIDNTIENIHIAEFTSKFSVQRSWIPPRSPHNLIEERLYHDPWALLTATIFLNKTSCTVARPFVFWFLAENPDPFKVLDKFPRDLEKYFCDLGLQRTRAVQVYRMSYDFLFKNWRKASELYGIGNYGESAFRMFCLGDFSAEPKDRFLKIYKAWYEKLHLKTESQGD